MNDLVAKELYRDWILENYTKVWKRITSEWSRDNEADAVWLMSAASYLFRTGGVRWAVDPSYSSHFVSAPEEAAEDLPGLELILLTHAHPDHFDTSLLKQLCRREDLVLAVPAFMSDALLSAVDEVKCDLRIVDPGSVVTVGSLKATAFESLHFDKAPDGGERIGCDEFGWLIESGNKRILIPGDVRDYSLDGGFPHFGPVDFLFAHLWLGRRNSIAFDEDDVDEFCRFMGHFNAKQVCFTHLHEISREPEDYWAFSHAGIVMDKLLTLHPETDSMAARTGQRINLW